MSSFLSWFVSPWGLLLLAVLDSSPLVFLPFANDFVVVYLAARSPQRFWLFPLTATIGAVIGTAVSYGAGLLIGENGLERWVPARRLERVRQRVRGFVVLVIAGTAYSIYRVARHSSRGEPRAAAGRQASRG